MRKFAQFINKSSIPKFRYLCGAPHKYRYFGKIVDESVSCWPAGYRNFGMLISINCANMCSIAVPMNTELGCTNVRRPINYAKYRNFGIRISETPRQLFQLTGRFLTTPKVYRCQLFQYVLRLLATRGQISFLPNVEE